MKKEYTVHAPHAIHNSDNVLNELYAHCEEVIKNYDEDRDGLPVIAISEGNIKVGRTRSVSRPPVFCCSGDCERCMRDCYAVRMYSGRNRKVIRAAWDRNMILSMIDPDAYFDGISAVMAEEDYFRYHVSGDITSAAYLAGMIRTARENPDCIAMTFTENYDVVNNWIDKNGDLPENLIILFSVHYGRVCNNPHNLPEAHIIYEDSNMNTLPENKQAFICPGNCETCQNCGAGCFSAKHGDIVAFNQH